MDIIYEDNKMLLINKEAGKLTQSAKSFELDLTSEVLNYRRKKGEQPYAAVINRLDRPVSGLVLFAKDKTTAARLTTQMQQQGFCKQYYAVICGQLEQKSGTFVDYLLKNAKDNTSSVVSADTNGAKRAELKYEVVKEYVIKNVESSGNKPENDIASGKTEEFYFSVVRIELITGRHHQIRVQFASRNLPLAGDVKYGMDTAGNAVRLLKGSDCGICIGRNEIALCAYSITIDKKTYSVTPKWLGEQL